MNVKEFFDEFVTWWLYKASMVASMFVHPAKPTSTKKDILLIYPWTTMSPLLNGVEKKLKKAGFNIIFPTLGTRLKDIRRSAKRLRKYVDKYNLKNVIAIGHSTGGLILLYYYWHLGGYKKIKKGILLASPVHGTLLAWFICFSKAGRQILPKSEFLKELNSKKHHLKKLVTMHPRKDELVSKASSIIMGVEHKEIDIVGHDKLLSSEKVVKAILQII